MGTGFHISMGCNEFKHSRPARSIVQSLRVCLSSPLLIPSLLMHSKSEQLLVKGKLRLQKVQVFRQTCRLRLWYAV